jgi:hypothetical protein
VEHYSPIEDIREKIEVLKEYNKDLNRYFFFAGLRFDYSISAGASDVEASPEIEDVLSQKVKDQLAKGFYREVVKNTKGGVKVQWKGVKMRLYQAVLPELEEEALVFIHPKNTIEILRQGELFWT